MALSRDGHTIECVENGASALEKISAAPTAYDLILTDHHMPVMNGLELVTAPRSVPISAKIIVFILTAIIDCGSKLTELCKFCIRFRPARKLLFDRFRDQGQSWEVGVVETVSPCSFPDALNRV